MTTLKSSRSNFNLNDSTSKSQSILDRLGTSTTPLARHNSSGLFTDLNSIRNDIRKQITTKLETGLLKQASTKSSPLKSKETRTGLFSNRAEQAAIIHSDLLNAVRGGTSQQGRRSPPRDNVSSRLNSLNDDLLRNRTSEARDKSPLDSLSRNLLALRGSVNSSKENLRTTAITTPLAEKNKQSSPLRSKLGTFKSPSQYAFENKYTSNDLSSLSFTSKTPKVRTDAREHLSKIFDSIGQNRTPLSKAESSRAGNPLSDLSQELDRLRAENRREYTPTPIDKTLRYPAGRATTSHTPLGSDRSFALKYERAPKETVTVDDKLERTLGYKRKPLADSIPLPKIYELQDALTDINAQDFDNLPASYIEDLVKLSSVIMHRIKASSYYSKQDRF